MHKVIGYYICEIAEVPDCFGIKSKTMISVSGCLTTIHPELSSCYFENKDSKRLSRDYAAKLSWKEEQLEAIRLEITDLFESGLAIDGRFRNMSDAQHFYQTYFAEANCVLVSVSTTEEFYSVLTSELNEGSVNDKVDFMTGKEDDGELLGYDILGWDISGFHSFLCNGLQKELPSARFNEFTLLENEFSEVVEFARRIQGKGEPVQWIPCRIEAVK